MSLVRKIVQVLMVNIAAISFAFAQDRGTADEAKILVEKGVAHVSAVGADKAFQDFSAKDGKWQNKDLYVFVIDFNGLIAAHGANKGMVGKKMFELKDPNGKPFVRDMAMLAQEKGSGWVDYMFTDPQTKKVGVKSSYVMRIPGYEGFMGVGIYK